MPFFSLPAYEPRGASALFVNTLEAAEMLHVSPWTVRGMVRRGELHAFRPVIGGKKMLLYASEVEKYARLAREMSAESAEAEWERYRMECLQ